MYLLFFVVFIYGRIIALNAIETVNNKNTTQNVIILWWTPSLFPHMAVTEKLITCKVGSCLTTVNRKYKDDPKTRGFIFYGTEIDFDDIPFPRLPTHEWALFHEESPMNNFLFSHKKGIKLFNHTSTFSRYSDYPLTSQFIPSLEYFTERKPLDIKQKNKLRKAGLAPLIYIQSNCNVASDRDRYVLELSKYISIDSYGKCLNNKTLPPEFSTSESFEDEEFYKFLSQYKFHLAFENAICDDYITEKLFRPLHLGSVPIYRGSPSVKDWLPTSQSAILVDSFSHPKNLATFIEELDKNDDAYLEYLSFKEPSGVTNQELLEHLNQREWGVHDLEKEDFISGFECYVCDQIVSRIEKSENNALLQPKIGDLNGCPEPQVSIGNGNTLHSYDSWLQQGWVESYWYSYDIAQALTQMIQKNENISSKLNDYISSFKYTSLT